MTIYHQHHIIPKHMGGSDDSSNLKSLTISEHAEAHKILYEEHGHWQDFLAWQGLAKLMTHDEVVLEASIRANLGKKFSKEHKSRISKSLIGHVQSEATKRKISETRLSKTYTNYGGPKSESHKLKCSEVAKNRPKILCRCGKLLDRLNYQRWHSNH